MTFIKTISVTALIIAFTNPLMAMDAPKVSKNAAAQPGGVYKLDPNHTSIVWKLSHMGVSNYTARFDKASGELNFNPANVEKSTVDIAIDPKSVSTGQPDFDREIAGEKFLNSGKNPDFTFKSTKVVKTGADSGKITGDLTLNGVTKPVTLDVKFNGGITHPMTKAADLGFSATTKIRRSDFNVDYGIPMVGDEVEIAIETEFMKETGKPE